MLSSSQRERRVSRLNRTGKNTTGWARRLTALLVTACLVMAMALPVYAEVDLLPDAPDEVELLEDEQGTASGENTTPPEQNAATPEPEQSAEPEQPAPTETPEPTAEPALTPEPAATATATPVPTVTPTATPEPTEQPQKMYAAESVDNVQAVSETEATDGFTVYFVVPDTMPGNNETVTVLDSDEIKFNVRTDRKPGNSKNDEWWLQLSMEPTGWKTEDGHKIYACAGNVILCQSVRYGITGYQGRFSGEDTRCRCGGTLVMGVCQGGCNGYIDNSVYVRADVRSTEQHKGVVYAVGAGHLRYGYVEFSGFQLFCLAIAAHDMAVPSKLVALHGLP